MSDGIARHFFDEARCDGDALQKILKINAAIEDALFNRDQSGRHVYMDFDEQALGRISIVLGVEPDNFKVFLCDALKGLLKSDPTIKLFEFFAEACDKWENSSDLFIAPPSLALLAVLSISADSMAASDLVRPTNFYTPLSRSLDHTNNQQFQNKYREHALQLWKSLKTWLDSWDGERGLVTLPEAALFNREGFWAIQLPISQALLSERDRQDIHRMFDLWKLDPSSDVPRDVMSEMLKSWCKSYGSVHIKTLWRDESLRDMLADAAISTLTNWAGPDTETVAGGGRFGVRLICRLDNFTKTFEFGLEFRNASSKLGDSLIVNSQSAQMSSLPIRNVNKNIFRLSKPNEIEVASLVSRNLEFESSDFPDLSGGRKPRIIVPMLFDRQSGEYREVERVALGFEHGILMKKMITGQYERNYLEQVEQVLDEIARPGWEILDPSSNASLRGLPDGWIFISHVQILSLPSIESKDKSLSVLMPIEVPGLIIEQGIRIPGGRERWLGSHPPVIQVIMIAQDSYKIQILNSSDEIVGSYKMSGSVGFFPLHSVNLMPGDYRVEVVGEGQGVVRKISLSLVNAESVNPVAYLRDEPILYDFDKSGPMALLTACRSDNSSSGHAIMGSQVLSDVVIATDLVQMPNEPAWDVDAAARKNDAVTEIGKKIFGDTPSDSCMKTGMHRYVGPRWHGGIGVAPRKGQVIPFVCKTCGIQNFFPAIPKYKSMSTQIRSGSNSQQSSPIRRFVLSEIPSFTTDESTQWDAAFHALCFMRRGSNEDLVKLISQVDSSAIAHYRYSNGLHALGHLDLELDDDLRLLHWRVTPAMIAMVSETTGILTGFRSQTLIETIRIKVESIDGTLVTTKNPSMPVCITITAPSLETLISCVLDIHDPVTRRQLQVVESAPMRMAEALPSLGSAETTLPKMRIPAYEKMNKWDAKATKWNKCSNLLESGAYQFDGFGVSYGHTMTALENDGQMTRGTAGIVKHIDARISKIPLMFYDAASRQFCVRMGAELPGLFGRAAVLCSGRTPTPNRQFLIYHDVPEEVALTIYSKVYS